MICPPHNFIVKRPVTIEDEVVLVPTCFHCGLGDSEAFKKIMEENSMSKPLEALISFEGFKHRMYHEHEKTILTPRLHAKGYHNIWFVDGEADNLGPLRRLCRCTDRNGKRHEFWYE